MLSRFMRIRCNCTIRMNLQFIIAGCCTDYMRPPSSIDIGDAKWVQINDKRRQIEPGSRYFFHCYLVEAWTCSQVAFRGSRPLFQLTAVTVLRGAPSLGPRETCTNFHISIELLGTEKGLPCSLWED